MVQALERSDGPGLFDRLITDDYHRDGLETLTVDCRDVGPPADQSPLNAGLRMRLQDSVLQPQAIPLLWGDFANAKTVGMALPHFLLEVQSLAHALDQVEDVRRNLLDFVRLDEVLQRLHSPLVAEVHQLLNRPYMWSWREEWSEVSTHPRLAESSASFLFLMPVSWTGRPGRCTRRSTWFTVGCPNA